MLRALSVLFVLFLIVAAAAGFAWHDYRSTMQQALNVDDGQTFIVERGWSAKRTANELANLSIIEKPRWFYLHARLQPQLTGSCLLYTSPSPRDLSTSRMPSSA